MDKIVIQVSGQADLDSTIKKLKELGIIDEKNAKAFQANNKKTQASIDQTSSKLGAFDKALSNIGPALAGAFAVGSLISFGKSVVDITAKFQKFDAVLTNTLGSKSEAQKALVMIKEFAASTPFSVEELTDSFVKLANQGFKPTQQELRKLGDIAASQGKSFNQLTEAIIDAQTGEFERLKEFGIRASKEGDKVKFTFKGVEQQVDFTSDSIRKYILSLGEAEGVSGSMAAISQTLEGQISNLGDAWDSLLNTIGSGNSGVLSSTISLFADMVRGIEDALTTTEQLDAQLRSMEMTARETELFAFLEEDIENLTKAGTEASEARRLVYANELINAEQLLKENVSQLEKHTKLFGNFISDPQKKILQEFKDNIEFYESTIKRLDESITNIDKEAKPQITSIESLREQIKLLVELRDKKTDVSDVAQINRLNEEIRLIDEQIKKLLGLDEATRQYLKARKEWVELGSIDADPIIDPVVTKKSAKEVHDERVKSMKDGMKLLNEQAKLADKLNEKQLQKDLKRIEDLKQAKQMALESAFQAAEMILGATQEAGQRRADQQIESINGQADAEIAALEKKKERGRISEEAYQKQREAIQKKAARKEAEIKTKQAKDEQKFALANIALNTAAAVIKGIAQFGPPPSPPGIAAIASALALGAIQAAIVASTPIPKFKEGVIDFKGKGTSTSDSNLVKISRGESVMTAKETRDYRQELEAMRKGTYDKYRSPVRRTKSLSEARHDSMAENIYKSILMQKGMDDSRIVNELRNKDFNIKNANKVGSIIASKLGDKLSENNLFR